jgi:hypothetical protein
MGPAAAPLEMTPAPAQLLTTSFQRRKQQNKTRERNLDLRRYGNVRFAQMPSCKHVSPINQFVAWLKNEKQALEQEAYLWSVSDM